MNCFDILSKQTHILGTKLLEASAGTGKTFAIEHLVTRCLLETDLKLDQILVITFTRAAARELKARIRSTLEKTIRGFNNYDYLKDLTQQQKQKLQEAVLCFDQAQLFTIHGFCHQMLTQHCFEAKAPFNPKQQDKWQERQEAIQFLRDTICPAEANLEVLKTCRYDIDRLIAQLQHHRPTDSAAMNQLIDQWKQAHPSFPDWLLQTMKQAVASPEFVSAVQKKYKAAIIDEFQDTDPVQWHIFQTLFFHPGMSAVYLVGDPKQSIYGFRNADIYTFLKATEAVGIENRSYLQTNYRSSPPLVQALNLLFSKQPWMELPALNSHLPVHPVQSKPGSQLSGQIQFFIARGAQTRSKQWPTQEMEETLLFPYLLQEIKNCSGTTAILIKDRYQARRVHQFLSRFGIQANLPNSCNLSDSPILVALEQLLQAVLHPQEIDLIKWALASPFFGWNHHQLQQLDHLQQAQELFFQLQTILQDRGMGSFVSHLLEMQLHGQTISERLISHDQIDHHDDLLELLQLILEENSVETAVQLLRDLKICPLDDRSRGFGGAEQISIMTVHASKGLEFDQVFALGLASRHTDSGLDAVAQKEKDAEKMRQLYVAMTRAKQKLYVPLVIDESDKPLKPGQASPIELFWQKISPSLEELSSQGSIGYTDLGSCTFDLSPIESPESPPLFFTPHSRPAFPTEPVLSFSSLSQKTHQHKTPPTDILPTGAETGVILHRLFEKLFTETITDLEQLVIATLRSTCLKGWEPAVCQLIEQVLDMPLLDSTFNLRQLSKDRTMTEMEFLFPQNGTLIKGFIDLVFEKDGLYYILDWKTNWLEEYTTGSIEKQMHDGDYFLQASLYAKALQRYLALFNKQHCFGGAIYLFVRGPTAYQFTPDGIYST